MASSDDLNCKVAAVIAAGGIGARLGATAPKQFLELAGKPVLVHTIDRILSLADVCQVVVASPAKYLGQTKEILERRPWRVPVQCVVGGKTRQDSVRKGVGRLRGDIELILVHDAVRPLCDRDTMVRVVRAAWKLGGAVPGLPATETIQRVSASGRIRKTPPRSELFAIQTPQCFRAELLAAALARARAEGFVGTDESSVVRWFGSPVTVVSGSVDNIKITHPWDLVVAEQILSGERAVNQGSAKRRRTTAYEKELSMRVGHGVDYHRLADGRRMILGGVEIAFKKGLLGHSDADVLTHSIADAVLGALGWGDIGQHFPDRDSTNRDRRSLEFLVELRKRMATQGWAVSNVDATLLAQRPRIGRYRKRMCHNIAEALGVAVDRVNIKATTTEGMNAEGREEGISAQAVALLERTRKQR